MNFKNLIMLLASALILVGCGAANTTKEQPSANALESGTNDLSAQENELGEAAEGELAVAQEEAVLTVQELESLDARFAYDSDVLSLEMLKVLDQHIAYLKLNPSASAKVEGNTDERGTNEYNLSLGERRAKSVFDYLVVSGIDGSRLETISYGELQPLEDCHEERCWSVNRRVEINYAD